MFIARDGFADLRSLSPQRDFVAFLHRLHAVEEPVSLKHTFVQYFQKFYADSAIDSPIAFSFWDDDPAQDRAVLVAAWGFDYPNCTYPSVLAYGEGVVGKLLLAIREGGAPEPLLAKRFGLDIPLPPEIQHAINELHFSGAIAFPLVLNGTVAGIFKIYSPLPLHPSLQPDDERLYLEQLRLSMLLADARLALSSSLTLRLGQLLGGPEIVDQATGISTNAEQIRSRVEQTIEHLAHILSAPYVDVKIGERYFASTRLPNDKVHDVLRGASATTSAEIASGVSNTKYVHITIERGQDHPAFSQFDQQLLSSAAETLAKYLSKYVILRELESQRERLLETSKRVSSTILQASTADDAIQALLEGIRAQFAYAAAIYFSAEGQHLHVHSSNPEPLALHLREFPSIEFAPDECEHAPSEDWHLDLCGACGRCQGSAAVAATRKHPVWVRKANLPQPNMLHHLGLDGVQNELALPIFLDHQVFGVVVLYRNDEVAVDGVAWQFATSLCNIAALALYNRQLLSRFIQVHREENKGEMALDVVHAVVPNNTALQIEAQLIQKAAEQMRSHSNDRTFVQKQAQTVLERTETIFDIIRQQENIVHPLRVLHSTDQSAPEVPVDIGKVIKDLVGLNARAFEQKRIRVRPIVHGVPRLILAREMDVYLILWNLLHNAAKFTRGTKPSTITITEQYAFDCVALKIRDEGVGIPLEHRHRIWENDFSTRAPGATRHTSGRGLFTVANLVTRIRGSDIQVSSLVNRGTEFIWTIRQPTPPVPTT